MNDIHGFVSIHREILREKCFKALNNIEAARMLIRQRAADRYKLKPSRPFLYSCIYGKEAADAKALQTIDTNVRNTWEYMHTGDVEPYIEELLDSMDGISDSMMVSTNLMSIINCWCKWEKK